MSFVTRLRQELRIRGFRAADGCSLSFEQIHEVVGRAFSR
jgi:hypothetical protein